MYDPLHAWTLTSEKAKRVQTRDETTLDSTNNADCNETRMTLDDSRNKMAERVLLRLKQKLCGAVGGTFLGVDGQVNYLIQEAQDIQNLGMLYPGWQPWL